MSNEQDTEQDNKLADYAEMREKLMQAFDKGHQMAHMRDYSYAAEKSGLDEVTRSHALQSMAQLAEAILKIDEKLEPQQGRKPRHVQKRAANAS